MKGSIVPGASTNGVPNALQLSLGFRHEIATAVHGKGTTLWKDTVRMRGQPCALQRNRSILISDR